MEIITRLYFRGVGVKLHADTCITRNIGPYKGAISYTGVGRVEYSGDNGHTWHSSIEKAEEAAEKYIIDEMAKALRLAGRPTVASVTLWESLAAPEKEPYRLMAKYAIKIGAKIP